MNKKLLFVAMSLAMLTACTDNDFESKQKEAQEAGAVQFEFVNDNDATRAAMMGNNNNKLVWSAEDKDLLTLYHGAELGAVTGYQNATYSIQEGAEGETAKLTTPTMILAGGAIMVWPADTTFRIASNANLSVVIPTEQSDIANQIPFVSDQIEIGAFQQLPADNTETAYNTAGWNRTYPVYMRPMASQLNIKADYGETDDEIEKLYEGKEGVAAGEGITPIKVTSIELLTSAGQQAPADPGQQDPVDPGQDPAPVAGQFTTKSAIVFNDANAAWGNLPATVHQNWKKVTTVNRAEPLATAAKLTTTFLNGNDGGKFLILPQPAIDGGVQGGAVVVNTIYGKVVVAAPGVQGSLYSTQEAADAWWRYVGAATVIAEENANHETKATTATTSDDTSINGKYKTTSEPAYGMQQTINFFGDYTAPTAETYVVGEYEGTKVTRYVKVLLTHLDMTDLHVKDDKQLRDVVRVWDKLGLEPVTVYLDGNDDNEFIITQKTIEVINAINAAKATANNPLPFKVQPCGIEDHKNCAQIVITGSAYKQDIQDVAFIAKNLMDDGDDDDVIADVVFADEGTATPWKWNGTVKVAAAGVNQFINEGTMLNAADATLKTTENNGDANNVPLVNNGTWDITGGKLFVQFNVTNNKLVNISTTAQYRQSGSVFTNEATTLPERFFLNDPSKTAEQKDAFVEQIGLVNNEGVFAVVDNNATINNYGLIEHANPNAKTYITTNQTQNANFANAFATGEEPNKMGRINLPYSNKNEDNISINAALLQGFVSVTVNATEGNNPGTGILNEDAVGDKVNYIIINGAITSIEKLPADQIKYVEINDPTKLSPNEIAWNLTDDPETAGVDESKATYEGLIVLSDVNIKLHTTINVTKACYLGADMYVGGIFSNGQEGEQAGLPSWNGYFGNTTANFATKYVTYGNN